MTSNFHFAWSKKLHFDHWVIPSNWAELKTSIRCNMGHFPPILLRLLIDLGANFKFVQSVANCSMYTTQFNLYSFCIINQQLNCYFLIRRNKLCSGEFIETNLSFDGYLFFLRSNSNSLSFIRCQVEINQDRNTAEVLEKEFF